MRKFTEKELAKYDGRNGVIYVAYRGKVYDVSKSYHWRNGIHQVMHRAGCDLTEAFKKAPHDRLILKRFNVVGELKK